MRKARLLLAAVVFVSMASSFATSHAGACSSAPKDPFGSCESGSDLNYHVHCAQQEAAPGVGAVTPLTTAAPSPILPPVPNPTPSDGGLPQPPLIPNQSYSQGVETCADGASLPVAGRAGVIVTVGITADQANGNNTVTVSATGYEDGEETRDPSVTGGWNRGDASTSVTDTNPGAAQGSTYSCFKRGETGTWDRGAPNTLDEGVSPAGANAGC